MKTVLVVSLFHPELIRGGAQQIAYELFQGLKQQPGIKPVLLASVDSNFPGLFKSGARITGFDGRPNEFLFLSRDYDYWWHKTINPLLVESFIEFLELIRPDVVHFHHFFTYGIDLLTVTRRTLPDARIVFTFHEFMAICAADGQMLRTTDKSLCRQASSVRCHQCIPERTPEQFFMRELWFKKHFEVVDAFTTPSRFMIEHYTDWGIDPAKIRHISNGQHNYGAGHDQPADPTRRRNRFAFFGQLVDNKGVHVIIDAVTLLRNEGFTDFVVEINGDNLRYATEPRRRKIEAFLEAEAALPPDEQIVTMNGSYQVDQLAGRMARIDWCIVPSTWWEIFGLVISEAWMFGKPILCSNVGGPKERIRHDIDGLHFEVGDPRSLAGAIRRACEEPGLWQRLHDALPEPPRRETMVEEFTSVYMEHEPADSASAYAAVP
ncbi:glycosyltransferase family 4 protein [Lichenicoccus sp.]|uniref:glycosyltransferase family 4 protein n=1 Tax=Lichenicoccus sp. TaxID=2781899 RepID=UPI003D110514